MTEKSLTLVKEAMTINVITFTKKTTASEALIVLAQHKISGAPVIDKNSKVIGFFTESDILRYFSVHPNQKLSILDIPIVYSDKLITTTRETPIYLIQQKFVEYGLRAIPVVDKNGVLEGIISRRDVLKYIFLVNQQKKRNHKK